MKIVGAYWAQKGSKWLIRLKYNRLIALKVKPNGAQHGLCCLGSKELIWLERPKQRLIRLIVLKRDCWDSMNIFELTGAKKGLLGSKELIRLNIAHWARKESFGPQ